MATTQPSLLIGVFTERGQADVALEELQGAGFSGDTLSLSQGQGGPQGGLLRGGIRNLFSKLRGHEENIVDELKSLGVPEEEAQHYQNEVNTGRSIVTVQADGRQEDARVILERNGAFDIKTHSS